jgi:hypothetical protein
MGMSRTREVEAAISLLEKYVDGHFPRDVWVCDYFLFATLKKLDLRREDEG